MNDPDHDTEATGSGAVPYPDRVRRSMPSDELAEDPSARLRVRVLGGLVLEHEGEVVPERALPGDARHLLAYLVLDGRRLGSAGRGPASALWPHDPGGDQRLEAARDELTRVLTGLLGPTRGRAETLDLTRDLATDLAVFTREAGLGMEAYRHDLLNAAERHLLAADAAYGGTLLDGVSDGAWLTVPRDDAAETHRQVVVTLAELADRRGDTHGAVRLLLRVLERDPYDERTHLRLVRCLEQAARRGESRRRYDAYLARMQELGVEPAPFPDVTPHPAPWRRRGGDRLPSQAS